MAGVEQTDGAVFAVSPRRRILLVSLRADGSETVSDLAAHIDAAGQASGIDGLAVEAFGSTDAYRPDPNRQQEFVPASAAIQLDYEPDDEAGVIELMQGLAAESSFGGASISAGHVVTCLDPVPASHLLLLGAQRKTGLTPEQFAQHWSQVHAPHAVRDLRAAPVPIGYELCLVDHDLTAAMATKQHPASAVDGWMHLTTLDPSDLAGVIRDPEHSAWVLEDEVNFVEFGAPLVGQHMRSAHSTLTTPSTTK